MIHGVQQHRAASPESLLHPASPPVTHLASAPWGVSCLCVPHKLLQNSLHYHNNKRPADMDLRFQWNSEKWNSGFTLLLLKILQVLPSHITLQHVRMKVYMYKKMVHFRPISVSGNAKKTKDLTKFQDQNVCRNYDNQISCDACQISSYWRKICGIKSKNKDKATRKMFTKLHATKQIWALLLISWIDLEE